MREIRTRSEQVPKKHQCQQLQQVIKHVKALDYGGTIGNLHTKLHAKYRRNPKQENVQEGILQ